VKWASAISEREHLNEALADCLEQLNDFGASVDLCLAFTTGFRQELEGFRKRLRSALRPKNLVGCSGGGVVGAGREAEGGKALAITVAHLPEVEINGFQVDSESLPDPDGPPDAWRDLVGISQSEPTPHFLLFSEPFSFDLDAFLRGLDYAYPHSTKLGGVAANARRPGGNRLLLDHEVYSRGLVGVALSGLHVDALVAQGCRPIGHPYTVTKGDRNLLFHLDHKTAMECLEETLRELPKRDRKRAEKSLLVGFLGQGLSLASLLDSRQPPKQEFLIRNLVGADLKRGALATGSRVRPGQTVQFHLRDAEAAREDLRAQLRAYHPASPPQAALLFTCVGRGRAFYGEPDYDSGQLLKAFPNLTIGGFFGGGEIGPVADSTYIHGYTACCAVFRSYEG
jgi:small ligand-binding sensory domain FIST